MTRPPVVVMGTTIPATERKPLQKLVVAVGVVDVIGGGRLGGRKFDGRQGGRLVALLDDLLVVLVVPVCTGGKDSMDDTLLDFIDLLHSRINTFLNDLVSNTMGRHKSTWKGRLEMLYIYNSSRSVLSHLDVNAPANMFIIPTA